MFKKKIPLKMDVKSDDILNIDIDPALLLSDGFVRLTLDDIANDIFEITEISKSDVNLDAENAVSSENEVADAKCILKSSTVEDKLCTSEIKLEGHPRIQKRKKDINGNEEPSSDENLNQLFFKLDLSDSDNEEHEDCSKLKERGPVRPQRRASRNRDQNNVLSRNESYDRSQFNSERLRFLSGSKQVQFNEITTTTKQVQFNEITTTTDISFTTHNNSASIISRSKTTPDSPNQDSLSNAVNSPESGYESCSVVGSPPPISTGLNLDYIPETVDEQNILDFLAENTTDCALTDNLSVCDSTNKDPEGKIIEIINYLKDIPTECNESYNAAASLDNTHEYVPLANDIQDLTTESIALSSLSSNKVSKSLETPKKLVYKLDDKAKRELRDFLSDDEFYAAKARIYRKISENKQNNEDVKVIYVENETDKTSENRTNLHHAVLNSKIEDIYCLVEIHKQYNKPLGDINIRDKYGKTALDYAIQSQMTLVVNYLKENTACQSVTI